MAKLQLNKIHYIEDSNDEIFITKILFRKQKIALELVHHVCEEDFLKAIEDRDDDVPTLVAVDLNMPGIRGSRVIKNLYEKFDPKSLIAGMCTGSEDPADKLDAVECGARFFIPKPLDLTSINIITTSIDELSLQLNDENHCLMFENL